jgi:DUF1009 family protein
MARRVTLVAGSGSLVPYIADAIRRRGDVLQVIDIIGDRTLEGIETVHRPLAQPERLAQAIVEFGPTHLMLAGGVHISDGERRGLADTSGAALGQTGALGDLGLATLIQHFVRTNGINLVDVHEIAPELVAPEGHIAGSALDSDLAEVAAYGMRTALAIGAIDLGQSVVVSANRPVAAEDAGGTDVLLQRVAQLRAEGRIGGQLRLVLAKSSKPNQPSFLDLPSIGGDTVVNAAAAGISAIVVEAGGSLLLDRAAIEREALAHGITVAGLRHG